MEYYGVPVYFNLDDILMDQHYSLYHSRELEAEFTFGVHAEELLRIALSMSYLSISYRSCSRRSRSIRS